VTRVHEVSPALAGAVFGYAPPWVRDFSDMSYEWRRLVAEFAGTFLLVLVGAGGGVIDAFSHGAVGRTAEVVSPALMVLAIILATGAVSGAHLNPVVSVAFALRREFPWRRIPLYVVAQVLGAVVACGLLRALFGDIGHLGATLPGPHVSATQAVVTEALLTFGLVTVILGTASGAQNVGPLSAIAVAGYIALAGLWSSPISGASMNPVRSLGPDVVLGQFGQCWIYLVGPTAGMLVAVGLAYVLRGRGADAAASRAAQGGLGTLVLERALDAHAAPPAPPTDPAH
jgi:aquaporin Z